MYYELHSSLKWKKKIRVEKEFVGLLGPPTRATSVKLIPRGQFPVWLQEIGRFFSLACLPLRYLACGSRNTIQRVSIEEIVPFSPTGACLEPNERGLPNNLPVRHYVQPCVTLLGWGRRGWDSGGCFSPLSTAQQMNSAPGSWHLWEQQHPGLGWAVGWCSGYRAGPVQPSEHGQGIIPFKKA